MKPSSSIYDASVTNAFTASGLFGSLLSDAEIAAEFDARAFTQRMLAFEAAWTKGLAECDVVSAKDAEAALHAIERFDGGALGEGSDRDGMPVPALVAALERNLDESAARAVHNGATSQDVIDTAMVLTLVAVLDRLTSRLSRVIAALDDALVRFGKVPLTARTRMQAALPSTAALRIDAWRRSLTDHSTRALAVKDEIFRSDRGSDRLAGNTQCPCRRLQPLCRQDTEPFAGYRLAHRPKPNGRVWQLAHARHGGAGQDWSGHRLDGAARRGRDFSVRKRNILRHGPQAEPRWRRNAGRSRALRRWAASHFGAIDDP